MALYVRYVVLVLIIMHAHIQATRLLHILTYINENLYCVNSFVFVSDFDGLNGGREVEI